MSEFYQITPEIAQALRKANLTASEWKIWSYLIEIDPWGDRYEKVETLAVMSACGVSKATFYRAIAKFQEAKIFDFQDNGFNIRNLHGIHSRNSAKSVSKMRQTSPISESQFCGTTLKIAKPVSKLRQLSQNCENQSSKVALSKDSGTPQIYSEDPEDPDRSEDFANAENLGLAKQTLTNLARPQNCDLRLDREDELTNTHEEVVTAINGDSCRRKLEDFILRSLQVSPQNRAAYFARFKPEDWQKWEIRFKPSSSPPVAYRDPVAEDPWRIENAIASMVKCRDFDSVRDRLSYLQSTNPDLAKKLREKYLGGAA